MVTRYIDKYDFISCITKQPIHIKHTRPSVAYLSWSSDGGWFYPASISNFSTGFHIVAGTKHNTHTNIHKHNTHTNIHEHNKPTQTLYLKKSLKKQLDAKAFKKGQIFHFLV